MKIFITILIVIIFAALGFLFMRKSPPRISLDRPSHDFGIVPQYGGVVKTEFTVKNSGDKTLEIGKLTTSCSCTSASISSSAIEGGESAILTVVFDPNLHEEPKGVFKRVIFIPSNDPKVPETEAVIWVDIDEGK